MAAGALALEHGLAPHRGSIGRLDGGLYLLVDPGLEVGRVHGNGLHLHSGMAETTELGALAEVDARRLGLDLPRRHAAGHGVALAVQRGDPVAVDHVAAEDLEADLRAGRDDQLVGRHNVGGWQVAGIAQIDPFETVEVVAELPPPLLADDHDLGIPRGTFAVDADHDVGPVLAVQVEVADQREDGDDGHDHSRADGPADLGPEVAVYLLGEFVGAVVITELPPDDRRRTEDDYEDDAGDEEDRVGQRVDGPRDRALRRQSVQRSVSGATGQGGEPTDGEGGEPPRTQETAQGLGDQWSVSA